MARLDGKVAIITGGASGMGRATSLLFSGEGAAVVVADIQDQLGEEVAAQCGERAFYRHTDVTQEADIAGVVAAAVERFGRLDIMFNNAGGSTGYGVGMDVAQWDHDFALNCRHAFLGMKYAVPEMRKAGGGSIISTSSDNALRPLLGTHSYAASKMAIVTLSQSVAQEVGPDNIRVNVISPGWMNTPMLVDGISGGDYEIAALATRWAQPIRRPGTAEDIANAALFLAGDESSFITGVTIPVDGGWLCQSFQNPKIEEELRAFGTPAWMDQGSQG